MVGVRFERVDNGVEHVTNECNTTGWRSARKTVGESRQSWLYRISNSICRPFRTLANFSGSPIIREKKFLLIEMPIHIDPCATRSLAISLVEAYQRSCRSIRKFDPSLIPLVIRKITFDPREWTPE